VRVLLLTVTAGAGHLQAAAALEEAWRSLRPRDTVERWDVLDFTSRLFRKSYAEGYLKVVERAPELYGFLFRKTDNPSLLRVLSRWRRLSARVSTRGLVRRLRDFRPDVVLATHFLPLEIMGALEKDRRFGARPYVVSVVTDFEAHALWIEPRVDLYCVASQDTGARLMARGVERGRVAATGIPIAAKFARRRPARDARTRLGLRTDVPTVLLLGGGFGVGPVSETLRALDKYDGPAQFLVVAGRNEALRERLSRRKHRHPTRVFGFVHNMEELMAAADLVATKPGGLTVSEALAVGKPLLVIHPIPGQEAANSDFLLERGAAVKVNRVEDLPFRLRALLSPARLRSLSRAARRLGRPGAAKAVCREVLERAGR